MAQTWLEPAMLLTSRRALPLVLIYSPVLASTLLKRAPVFIERDVPTSSRICLLLSSSLFVCFQSQLNLVTGSRIYRRRLCGAIYWSYIKLELAEFSIANRFWQFNSCRTQTVFLPRFPPPISTVLLAKLKSHSWWTCKVSSIDFRPRLCATFWEGNTSRGLPRRHIQQSFINNWKLLASSDFTCQIWGD